MFDFFLAMDFTPHFVFNFQSLNFATRIYLDIFSFYMTHGDMVQILVQIFSSPETQKPKVFHHNIQATIYLPSFAEGDCRHHYRNVHDTWGFGHLTVVTSGESHPHLPRNFIGNYFDQRYRSGVFAWGQQNSWPTKTRFLDMDIDVNFGVGHLLNGKRKADTKPPAELGFLPRSLGKRSINFILGNHLQLCLSATIIQLVHHIIRFENIHLLRHRHTFFADFNHTRLGEIWSRSNRLLLEVGCF